MYNVLLPFSKRNVRVLLQFCIFVLVTVKLLQGGSYEDEGSVADNKGRYIEPLENILSGRFERPEAIVSHSKHIINLGMIIINLKKTEDLGKDFKLANEKTLRSMLTFSSGTPMHWVIVTDDTSVRSVARFVTYMLTKMVTEAVILRRDWKWKRRRDLPLIQISFVDLKDIANTNRPFVSAMKEQALQVKEHKSTEDDKYVHDLFYIAPLYHTALSSLDNLPQ